MNVSTNHLLTTLLFDLQYLVIRRAWMGTYNFARTFRCLLDSCLSHATHLDSPLHRLAHRLEPFSIHGRGVQQHLLEE